MTRCWEAKMMNLDMPVCEVCGKNRSSTIAASAYGAISFAYCEECLQKGMEPYWAVVAYISCAGCFPKDINDTYKKDVRRMLPLWGKSEDEFIADAERAIQQEKEDLTCQ